MLNNNKKYYKTIHGILKNQSEKCVALFVLFYCFMSATVKLNVYITEFNNYVSIYTQT